LGLACRSENTRGPEELGRAAALLDSDVSTLLRAFPGARVAGSIARDAHGGMTFAATAIPSRSRGSARI
jgi:hypothetical protein